MKKYILSTLIIAGSIISFTNASSMECNATCNIDTANKQGCFIQINSCEGSEGTFAITPNRYIGGGNSEGITDFEYESCQQTLEIQEGYDFLSIYNYNNKNFTLDYSLTCNTNENIIAGGTEAFSGIIERLGSIFGEFGPYMIYIAIACLGISLMFKALKYILGFTDNSAKNSIGGRAGMKERRTRRRRNRRLQRYIYRNERGRYGETYNQKQRKQYKNNMKFGSRGYNSRK